MIRSAITTTFAASLLFLSASVSGNSPNIYRGSDETVATTEAEPPAQQHQHSVQYWSCMIPGHRHPVGQPCPVVGYGFGNNQGSDGLKPSGFGLGILARAEPHVAAEAAPAPPMAPVVTPQPTPVPVPVTVPMPAGPPPNGLLGGLFAPQRYRQMQPMPGQGYPPGYPMAHAVPQGHVPPPGYPMAHAAPQGHIPPQGQPMVHAAPQGHVPPQGQVHHPQGYGYPPVYQVVSGPERIVYVPYAMPPPVQVERLAKALPRPPIIRRVLGDVKTYEYPEMPQRMYTTRGPRDFFAANPPSIGY